MRFGLVHDVSSYDVADLVPPVTVEQVLLTVRTVITRRTLADKLTPQPSALWMSPAVWEDLVLENVDPGRWYVVRQTLTERQFMGIPIVEDPTMPPTELRIQWPSVQR